MNTSKQAKGATFGNVSINWHFLFVSAGRVMKNIIIFGGSFDPPHNGHLNTALAVQDFFHFDRFVFLPCKQPILKDASIASAQQRLTLLKLALAKHPEFIIDTRELSRKSRSYKATTLKHFREEFSNHIAITLLVGLDAFLQLPQWHDWQSLLTLTNLLVISRPGFKPNFNPVLQQLLANHEVTDKSELLTKPHGAIYLYDAGKHPISSTYLRSEIKAGRTIKPYVPFEVYEYIEHHGLYKSR